MSALLFLTEGSDCPPVSINTGIPFFFGGERGGGITWCIELMYCEQLGRESRLDHQSEALLFCRRWTCKVHPCETKVRYVTAFVAMKGPFVRRCSDLVWFGFDVFDISFLDAM